ncbi:MAG TPA: NAD(P)H-dependent oxidoreductase [bacterium]|nr:NAD(P)H-dependent oxidoreductase [bacterium]
MLNLLVIVTSTRPRRSGWAIGQWFTKLAEQHGAFHVTFADLAEVNLPLLDEPAHPSLRQYEHEHTKAWSTLVSTADAFVFVMPEYNFFAPPTLVNAVDYLYHEWHYKPAGFVSYGGASGGMRSVQSIKSLLTSVNVMPLPTAVAIPFFSKHIDETKGFVATEQHEQSAKAMLDELRKWAVALETMREPAQKR